LTVPALSDGLRTTLAGFLPKAAGLGNPIDLIASAGPDEYRRSIEAVLRSDEVDALIVIHIPVGLVPEPAVSKAIREGVAAARATGKPVLGCWMGEATEPSSQEAGASTGDDLPTYPFPELPARVLAMAARYGEWRVRPTGVVVDFEDMDWDHARGTCRQALEARGGGWLTANETRAVLTALRLPVPAGGVARTVDDAVSLAEKIGYPVAAKLASHQIVHKTEMGVIHLRLSSADEVRAAFTRIRERLVESDQLDAMEGVLIQPMISGGLEVMVGVTQDPLFGPLLAFGLGGIHVEILRDVAFRITPLTDQDAREMVREIKGFRLLEGYRGHPPADVQAIEEILLRLSRFVEEIHEVTELDLNPVFALAPGEGCRIVDARIKVGA
ncbi:MAG: acetate--CoA ligase family protein, partial [Nitrospirales bacterium]